LIIDSVHSVRTRVFRGPVCQIPWLTVANFLHIVINFLGPLNPPNIQYLSPVTATDRYSLSTKLTDNVSDKLSSQYFQYSSRQSPSGSHVFHGEIMYTYSTVARTSSKYAVFVPYITGQYQILQNSMKT